MKKSVNFSHLTLFCQNLFLYTMIHLDQEESRHTCKLYHIIRSLISKLLKFRGKDFGRSKFEIEKGVQQIEFPEGVTLKSIFAPLPESTVPDDRKTAFGEIVYQRHALDFSNKNY
jgi:hypothetical protein